jgi:hypothetical protein
MKLVVTPRPLPTECITGYLHTLSAANGYPSPRFLLACIANINHDRGYRIVKPSVLVKMTGIDLALAEQVCLSAGRHLRGTSMLGKPIHNAEIRVDAFRICPRCIREGKRHEASWHLKVVNWCAVHRTRLLERCEVCKKPITWNRPSLGQCKCGADLTAQGKNASKCSKVMWRLTRAVEDALYDHVARRVPSEMTHLAHLNLYSVSRIIMVLSEQFPPGETRITHGRKRDLLLTEEQLENAALLLDNWPHNFRSFLRTRYERTFLENPLAVEFRSAFSWAFRALHGRVSQCDDMAGVFLRTEIYRFGAQYLSKEQLARGENVLIPPTKKWGSVPEAAAAANMDARTILKRVHAGEIPAKAADCFQRNRNYLVDLDWIRNRRTSEHAAVHIRIAAKRLGLSVLLLQVLKREGLYPVRYHLPREFGFSEEDIQSFSATLDRLSNLYSPDGTREAIAYEGVSLGATKSVDARVEAMKSLKKNHPDFWSVDAISKN